ncbi:hypothetical protein KVR01_007168 [Diaporthe batatas]|uniref:uncharacterized protein n=1 Tax=Diaporthe batatas TaxID=748121 RepID=UPI001D040BEC|nr:uncharacterized protein KVR01_007168 [Diaporthe batatas]KAG8162690.1 hypothetical protein KVR01_007168 [Diaporthe batatas]
MTKNKKATNPGQKAIPPLRKPKLTQQSKSGGGRGPRKAPPSAGTVAPRRATRSTTKPGDLDSGHRIQNPSPKLRSRKIETVVPPAKTGSDKGQRVLRSVETGSSSHSQRGSVEFTPDWDSDEASVDKDPLQVYYERIGYLPPLDDATVEVLKFLKMSCPDLDVEAGRISSSNVPEFRRGLQCRMVDLLPKGKDDFQFKELENHDVPWPLVPADVKDYDDKLWEKDLEKCQNQEQEAIFQRTIMLSMIDRYRLFYGGKENQSSLEFAVETPWTCLPMPTHAERRGKRFLTCPKPDLAVGFRREKLVETCDWESFPEETQKLICYEGINPPNQDRAFCFLTIEAKRGWTSVDDKVALNQCLNNASQALHNMFEIFKEADREIGEGSRVKGDKYTKQFFERVRFFSVVAVAGAMKIRIHRACRLGEKEIGPKSDYPLKFAYSNYKVVQNEDFTRRQSVVEELTNILHNYGVNELEGLLKNVIREMNDKFVAYNIKKGYVLNRGSLFYSYNQAVPPSRKNGKATPRTTQTPSGAETPVQRRSRSFHRQQSSLSRSFSDNFGQFNVNSGVYADSGQVWAASGEMSRDTGMSHQQDVPEADVRGSPSKKRKK